MDIKFHLLETITNDFSEELKIGSGGYGDVYKGWYNGEEIAMKKLHQLQGLDDSAFENEFCNLSKVKHQNVVRLLGYCCESRHTYVPYNGYLVFTQTMERVLCFEYMHGGSLDKHIKDESCDLDWPTSYQIIKGISEGLNHLHSEQNIPIYHLELKPANVLLDKNMLAKIGDLGLSRLVASTKTHKIEMNKGAQGYMPPEYVDGGYISKKFDVFSLGVIILKIMAGNEGYYRYSEMSPEQFTSNVIENWQRRLHGRLRYSSHVKDILQVKKCVEIALQCVEKDRNKRPHIKDIVHELQACDIGEYDDGESSLSSKSISTFSSLQMADQVTELEALENVLIDANAEPTKLSYPFIRYMTGNFSQEIGRGGFGVVYLGNLRTGKVAVKKLSIAQGFSDALFVDEIKCLIRTKHRNIVRFLGYCADSHGELVPFNRSYVLAEVPQRLICFEYVPNGNLHKYLKDKSYKDDWQIRYQMIRGICHGLNYLHNQRINHLDLKPDNILLDAHLEPKITDFGVSRCFDEGISRVYTEVVRGTPGSIAPEIIDSGEITFKSDIYGLGIIIIKLLTGRNNYDFENWHISVDVDGPQVKSCIKIAQTCVAFNQHERPTIGEIMQKLDEMESL